MLHPHLYVFSIVVSVLLAPTNLHAQLNTNECVTSHAEAQALRNRGALLEARQQLLRCARRECPKLIADDCATWVPAIDDSLSSVVFAVSTEDGHDLVEVEVSADGKPLTHRTEGRALPIDPGLYHLRFSAPGYQPTEVLVSFRQSEKNRIVRVHMAPLPAAAESAEQASAPTAASAEAVEYARPVPVATWVMAGTTVVGAGMFALFGLNGLAKEHKVERLTMNDSCGELCSAGRRDYVLADIGLALAVSSAVGALTCYWLRPEERTEPGDRARLTVVPLRDGALLRGVGRF
jgi:hypothetical protein